jgi:hypothetical protein
LDKDLGFPTKHGEFHTDSNGRRTLCWRMDANDPEDFQIVLNCLSDYPLEPDLSTPLNVLVDSIVDKANESHIVVNEELTVTVNSAIRDIDESRVKLYVHIPKDESPRSIIIQIESMDPNMN